MRRRLLAFVALSAVLLLAFSAGPLRALSAGVVAWTASTILEWCWRVPVGWSLTAASDIAFAVPAHDAWERGTLEIQALLFVRNMPLFVAATLALGWGRSRRLAAILGGGLVALVLLDGAVVAYMAWHTLAAGVRPASVAFAALAVPSAYHSTGGMFVAPVFIVAFLTWLLPASPATIAERGAEPNAPCPCGSGLKAKRCCRRV